jgi:hypothetical protein
MTNIPYVTLNRDIPETQAASGAVLVLKELGIPHYNLGQGIETEIPWGIIEHLFEAQFPQGVPTDFRTFASSVLYWSNAYNTIGSPDQRKIAADFMLRMFGIGKTGFDEREAYLSTFLIGSTGRATIREALTFYGDKYCHENGECLLEKERRVVFLPEDGWAMWKNIVRQSMPWATIVLYDHGDGQEMPESFEALIRKHKPVAVLINSPHNATGMRYGANWMKRFFTTIDGVNNNELKGQIPICIVGDLPYWQALERGTTSRLDGHYEYISNRTARSPYFVFTAATKALSYTNGFTLMQVSPFMAEGMKNHLVQNSTGISHNPLIFAMMTELMREKNEPRLLEWLDYLREKYSRNNETLEKHMGEMLIPGHPMMMRLARVKSDLTAREITEFALNGIIPGEALNKRMGTVMVGNGTWSRDPEIPLVRIALSQVPEKFKEAALRACDFLSYVTETRPGSYEELMSKIAGGRNLTLHQ